MKWIVDLMETYGKLKLAAEAAELQDNRQVLATDRAVVDAHHRRTHGDLYQSPEGDDMIHIGDQHHHYPPQPPKKTGRLAGLLGKAALGFAVGGPIGLGLTLAPVVADWLKPDPPPAAAPHDHTDRDSVSGIELLDPRFPEDSR